MDKKTPFEQDAKGVDLSTITNQKVVEATLMGAAFEPKNKGEELLKEELAWAAAQGAIIEAPADDWD